MFAFAHANSAVLPELPVPSGVSLTWVCKRIAPSAISVDAEPRERKRLRRGTIRHQKHAARRLHYDLRLELDGVMKSWAVTRGPSMVPGEKRLAVQVEDHPIEYNSFEARSPGQYGGGTVMIWDRGTWTEGDAHKALKTGQLTFSLNGKKLQGTWHLVRLRGRPGEQGQLAVDQVKDETARTPRIRIFSRRCRCRS